MKLIRLLSVGILLVGCGSTMGTYSILSPDGKENWIGIKCGSELECMSRAGYECPSGYSKLGADGHWSQESNAAANAYFANAHSGEVYRGEWLIKCNGKSRVELERETNSFTKDESKGYRRLN